ncbi:MAG: bifunctional 5,10-methylenetetrahydrofolate dehydrogenase/5,10-methenyltetrahydrofolate cyclohydrolase [Candidatus Thorarchaeota archaeon]
MTSFIERNLHKCMDGNKLSEIILSQVKDDIQGKKYSPRLAAIIVGNDPSLYTYQRMKEKKCAEVGIRYSLYVYKKPPSQEELTTKIRQMNDDPDVTGVMVQLPLPSDWNENRILELIETEKDVDGLNYVNIGRSLYNSNVFVPCAAEGIMTMLKHYHIPIEGKKAVVLGRGRLLGTPVAMLLEHNDAFVTKIHSVVNQTDIERELKAADIVISATGKPCFIKASMLKEGVITIDCGNTRQEREFEDRVFEIASHFSTTPGGVGPMTIAILINNTLKAYKHLHGVEDE